LRSRPLPDLNRGGQSPSGPSEDTFSGPAVDNETALRDGCTGAVYTKPIQETLFLVRIAVHRSIKNKKQSLTPNSARVERWISIPSHTHNQMIVHTVNYDEYILNHI